MSLRFDIIACFKRATLKVLWRKLRDLYQYKSLVRKEQWILHVIVLIFLQYFDKLIIIYLYFR